MVENYSAFKLKRSSHHTIIWRESDISFKLLGSIARLFLLSGYDMWNKLQSKRISTSVSSRIVPRWIFDEVVKNNYFSAITEDEHHLLTRLCCTVVIRFLRTITKHKELYLVPPDCTSSHQCIDNGYVVAGDKSHMELHRYLAGGRRCVKGRHSEMHQIW